MRLSTQHTKARTRRNRQQFSWSHLDLSWKTAGRVPAQASGRILLQGGGLTSSKQVQSDGFEQESKGSGKCTRRTTGGGVFVHGEVSLASLCLGYYIYYTGDRRFEQ